VRIPAFDLRAQPEARTTGAQIEDRSGHVGIPPQVQADRVAVGDAKDPRHVMRVNEVI
jgi:hypothetical protein